MEFEGREFRFTFVRDITARKHAERQAMRAQRLESIGTLAGGLAHDLNNALAPIMMSSELLRMQYPGSAELIDTIEASAARGAEMVRQLLTFVKGAEGARLPVHCRKLFQEMERIVRGTFPKSIALRTSYAKDLRPVVGDSTQLHQVLLNLCVNARDAMPQGGTLTLEAENMEVDATFASAVSDAKPGSYIVWRVIDTGTGIPNEILDKIFEPFFSTKGSEKGTGLGLSTVIGIIKSHGGFIRVCSGVGEGSTFEIYLPAARLGEGHEGTSKSKQTFRGNGELVLIVDDEAVIRQTARSVLTSLKFNVLTARDGVDALVHVTEQRSEIRAVITDLDMPQMDGLAFARILTRILPEAGIIVASGRIEEREQQEFKTLGIKTFLAKPFNQEQLIEALESIFSKT